MSVNEMTIEEINEVSGAFRDPSPHSTCDSNRSPIFNWRKALREATKPPIISGPWEKWERIGRGIWGGFS
ncbi:MAG: hypothetical protein ABL903_19580 [Methylococcales bacterium]